MGARRRQLSAMLRAAGEAPPCLDGWAFGEAEGALVQTTEGRRAHRRPPHA